MVATDPEMVKQIMVKDFDHFIDFGITDEQLLKIEGNSLGLANTLGEEWKRLR